MSKCGGCGKFMTGGAVCTKCKAIYHRQCVNMTVNPTPKNWICPCCVVNVPRHDNTNTPVKDNTAATIESVESSPSLEEGQEQCLILDEIRAFRREMNKFRDDFLEVREEIKTFRILCQRYDESMGEFSDRLDKQNTRLTTLETSCLEINNLKSQICDLKRELTNKEQLSLINDIEISGVTEHKGESIAHISGLILKKIGEKIDERDIVEVRRVGPMRLGQDGKQISRPIVMRVTRRAVREQVLRAARTRRNLTTADIEVAGPSRPIYINERLTKDNRVLFGRARAVCRQHNWKFAWTREGKVLIREADGKQAFRINGEDDIKRIFKLSANNNEK